LGVKRRAALSVASKKCLPHAAQVNATMGHALDYDDVHDPAVLHPGVVIIPTCFAVAERKGEVNAGSLLQRLFWG